MTHNNKECTESLFLQDVLAIITCSEGSVARVQPRNFGLGRSVDACMHIMFL